MQDLFTYALIFCGTAHLVAAATMALFARYKVEYLAIAWIMGLFSAAAFGCVYAVLRFYPTELGLLHPLLVLALLSTTFLQTIYPLSFTMPGYLQLGRMLKYASPAAAIILFYCLQGAFDKAVFLGSWADVWHHLPSPDVLLRFAALLLSVFYISGMIVLPRRLLHGGTAVVPRYVKGYSTAMALAFCLYMVLCINFDEKLMLFYIYVFTFLNLYITLRTLETMARRLLKPSPSQSPTIPSPALPEMGREIDFPQSSLPSDFNEANQQRYARAEQYMAHTTDWASGDFGRDRLCAETGINRHLMLQALRSQGWNNIHEYINSYRVALLKRYVETYHDPQLVNCCYDSGFGTIKTARSAFERFYGMHLDDFWNDCRANG